VGTRGEIPQFWGVFGTNSPISEFRKMSGRFPTHFSPVKRH
jgi:hypothetical protein